MAEILEAAWEIVRAEGLAALSMRDLAQRVGMQAPSLYQYFDSKHAIYDAMFAQGYRQFLDMLRASEVSGSVRDQMRYHMRQFVEFCVADPARYQLLFQRTIPGFEPSPESYAIAVEALDWTRAHLAGIGVTHDRHVDLLTAVSTGLTDQQISNDPGGDRWLRLVDAATDMYLAHVKPRRHK